MNLSIERPVVPATSRITSLHRIDGHRNPQNQLPGSSHVRFIQLPPYAEGSAVLAAGCARHFLFHSGLVASTTSGLPDSHVHCRIGDPSPRLFFSTSHSRR